MQRPPTRHPAAVNFCVKSFSPVCRAKLTNVLTGPPGRCHKRPACTNNDFYEVHSPCDEMNDTLVTYAWVEPRVCRDDLPASAKLPPGPPTKKKCPPCNPGQQMDYATGTCQFCPAGSISDGVKPCRPCPPSTAPNTGLQFLWWGAGTAGLPSGMSQRCMSLEGYAGTGCTTGAAWVSFGDHLRTAHGHAPDAYLILSLKVKIDRSVDSGRIFFHPSNPFCRSTEASGDPGAAPPCPSLSSWIATETASSSLCR